MKARKQNLAQHSIGKGAGVGTNQDRILGVGISSGINQTLAHRHQLG
jgi:hypothetical protein